MHLLFASVTEADMSHILGQVTSFGDKLSRPFSDDSWAAGPNPALRVGVSLDVLTRRTWWIFHFGSLFWDFPRPASISWAASRGQRSGTRGASVGPPRIRAT